MSVRDNEPEFIDSTGTPRPTRDIIDALKCIENEMLRNPTALAKDGAPLLIHYIVIRDVLVGELVRRKAQR
jgi:hypothetical protein